LGCGNYLFNQEKKAEEVKDYEKFKDYFEFEQPIKTLKDAKASHRFLAMRRGMTLKVLKIDVNFDENITIGLIRDKYFSGSNKNTEFLEEVAKKIKLTVYPSIS
jgi:transcriptional accessory protein Tex/SPT6